MIEVIDALSAGATFLLLFLILTNPRGVNKKANRWMAIFLFSVFVQMLDTILYTHKIYHAFPHLLGLSDIVLFLIPPSFYLTVLNYVTPERPFYKRDWVHFSVLLIYLLLILPFLTKSAATKLQLYETETSEPADYVLVILILLQFFLYFGLSIKRLNRHQKNIQMVLSSQEPVNLIWLKYFLVGFLFMVLFWGLNIFFNSYIVELTAAIVYLVMALILAYYSLHQAEVYSFTALEKQEIQELIEENTEEVSRKKQYLQPDQLKLMIQKLTTTIEQDRPYLDNELNLPKLADLLDTNIHVLSYVINEGFGENFSQFVNRYRVEEAKRLLDDPQTTQLNMLGIAFDAGFNSKTAFNTTFKKLTGLSPSEYKNRRPTSQAV